MPPRTRTRVKVLKENVDVVKRSKPQTDGKVLKKPRKALADKTNSLSDDNASIDIPIKASKAALNSNGKKNTDNKARPRRDRRLPPRYVENQVLKNLSNSKESPVKKNPVISQPNTPVKVISDHVSISLELHSKQIAESNTIITKAAVKENNSTKGCKITRKAISCLKPEKNALKQTTDVPSIKKSDLPSLKPVKNTNNLLSTSNEVKVSGVARPKRNCRLLSAAVQPASIDTSLNVTSPFKTPSKDLESSLLANRPKRIHRLPSKFEDHSMSPNKFIPVQPCHASTPIIQKNTKIEKPLKEKENVNKINKNKATGKQISKVTKFTSTKTQAKANSSNSSLEKSSPDTNNNGKKKNERTKTTVIMKERTKQASPKTFKPFTKRLLDKSLSFRVLEDRKQSKENAGNLDVYEFTFDPNEEPTPQKKKRKRAIRKKPAKPKIVVPKLPQSCYNDNISKALASLKSKVKPSQSQPVQSNDKPTDTIKNNVNQTNVQSTQLIAKQKDIPQHNYSVNEIHITPVMPVYESEMPAELNNESAKNSIHESNYASICIEDIAAEFDPSDHHDDINYSPVNSPQHPQTSEAPETSINPVHNKDPLNLQSDLSFFDENPVASSSMNVSTRHPLASPWRVEFTNLPMKWHSNTYVKPNMTPAVESSFINPEEMAKKKHIYTSIVHDNDPLPEIDSPNLKQPSIISFMKEVAERSANKKKRRRSPSPTKANSIFEDVTNTSHDFGFKTPKKAKKNESSISNNKSDVKENSKQPSNKSVSPTKPRKEKDKDCTYFGFDDTEIDQENVSPVKEVPQIRRGLRSRPALQDFNQAGPTRAVIPVGKAKMTSSEVVEQLYDQLKSAEVAPDIPEKETATEPADETEGTKLDDPSWHDDDDDDQSVHLFEDIDVVHHLKPHRKSYGKAKKVAFRQRSNSDSDTAPALNQNSSDDDLADLTFHMPNVKQKRAVKKKKSKKQLSKKEEKEVEEWAAGFNSMCEDVEDFALVVE